MLLGGRLALEEVGLLSLPARYLPPERHAHEAGQLLLFIEAGAALFEERALILGVIIVRLIERQVCSALVVVDFISSRLLSSRLLDEVAQPGAVGLDESTDVVGHTLCERRYRT